MITLFFVKGLINTLRCCYTCKTRLLLLNFMVIIMVAFFVHFPLSVLTCCLLSFTRIGNSLGRSKLFIVCLYSTLHTRALLSEKGL